MPAFQVFRSNSSYGARPTANEPGSAKNVQAYDGMPASRLIRRKYAPAGKPEPSLQKRVSPAST
jgi:hypothetical protein